MLTEVSAPGGDATKRTILPTFGGAGAILKVIGFVCRRAASVKTRLTPARLKRVKTNRLLIALGTAAVVAAGGACDRQDGVRTYSAPKDPKAAPAVVAGAAAPVEAEGGSEIHFTAPPDWKPLGRTGMSVATYRVADNPPLD